MSGATTTSILDQPRPDAGDSALYRWYRTFRPLLRDPFMAASLAILVILALLAIAAPLITRYDPNEIDPLNALAGPSGAHWLGTDENGRDELTRLIYGARVSLSVGLFSVGIALVIGVPMGLVAGYLGGVIGGVIMRIVDGVLAFPSIILALAITTILGPGLFQIMLAIGITTAPVYARVTHAQTLSLREQDFVKAGIATGASSPRIMFRYLLPNTMAPLIVQASLGMAFAILTEAGLSFLGVGIRPPTATWGGMLQKALARIYTAPSLSMYPGIAIFVVVLALNLLGDGIRDVLDPRLRGRGMRG
jgi:peptide/nickel transport system permease protein